MATINRDRLLRQFEAHLLGSALAPATVVNYMADLRAFSRWCEQAKGASCSPLDLSTSDIRAYCSYLKETKKHASTTVNRRLQALRKFYDWAVAQAWISVNPAGGASLLRETASVRSRSLSPEDVDRLKAAVRAARHRWAARDRALVEVLLGAGLKLSELTMLRMEDVQLQGNQPCVVVDDAGSNPGRAIPLDPALCKALRVYLDVRQASLGVDRFFVNRDGKPLSTRSIQRLLYHYARAAGLHGLTTQALRYVYATAVYESCGDLETVARRLGHKHLATTIRYLRPGSKE